MVNCVVSIYGNDNVISQCSRTCEGGTQRRKVECFSPMEDKVLPDQECNLAIRPREFRTCNNDISCGEIYSCAQGSIQDISKVVSEQHYECSIRVVQ